MGSNIGVVRRSRNEQFQYLGTRRGRCGRYCSQGIIPSLLCWIWNIGWDVALPHLVARWPCGSPNRGKHAPCWCSYETWCIRNHPSRHAACPRRSLTLAWDFPRAGRCERHIRSVICNGPKGFKVRYWLFKRESHGICVDGNREHDRCRDEWSCIANVLAWNYDRALLCYGRRTL